MDTDCVPTLTECIDFQKCINKNSWLQETENIAGRTNGSQYEVKCDSTTNNAHPATNGQESGLVTCICDGKVECEWTSPDFLGPITEDDLCISESNCPLKQWFEYEGTSGKLKTLTNRNLDYRVRYKLKDLFTNYFNFFA